MNKILIGTTNSAKLATYKELLIPFGLEVVSAKDLNIPAPEENSKTFEEEAVKKAQYYFEKSKIPTIVDDGGFMIEALNGEPGLKSGRWIGRDMTDDEIIAEVMKRMVGVPPENRACKFSVIIGLATPFGIFTSHGEIAGVVAQKPCDKRIEHFPYRSVMYLPNYGKYWVELNAEEDQILNHRKAAVEKLHDILKELAKG
jgi:XTP/dITP diphosphohydrolase